MNVFIPENPTVRVYISQGGLVATIKQNIVPKIQFEVVELNPRETVEEADARMEKSLPFQNDFTVL